VSFVPGERVATARPLSENDHDKGKDA